MERAELDQWKAKEVARLLALVETERRYYQDIVAALPIGLLVVSADLEVLSANRAVRRGLKLRSAEILHRPIQEILPLPGLAGQIEEVIRAGGVRSNLVFQNPENPDGPQLRVSLASLRGGDDETEREALVLVEDLAALRAVMTPAPQPAAVAPAPADNAPAIRWQADAATLDVRLLNGATETVLGYSPEQSSVLDFWWAATAPEDTGWVRDFFRQAAAQSEIRQCDHRMLAADGRKVWVRSVLRPVADARGTITGLAGSTIDITPVRAREDELQDARTMDAIAGWSGRLTHDFNNLLMIVSGYGQEILDSLPVRDPRRSDLQEILRTAERVSGMVRELMTLSRPPIAEPLDLDLNTAIREMESRLRIAIGGQADLRCALAPRTAMVRVDPAHLETMITTLVRQAASLAGQSGRMVIETQHVELGARFARPDARPTPCVKLKLVPVGVEVDEDTRTRLFEPLLAVKEPGLAPGLFPICGLVRLAGGEVRVEREGEGTVALALYLPEVAEPAEIPPPAEPAAPAEPAEPAVTESLAAEETADVVEIQIIEKPEPAQAAPRLVPAAAPFPSGTEAVMVVEDDPGIRALVRKVLQRQGFTVLEAASGEEALELSERHLGPIPLLVTDLMMPQMGGRELSEHIRASRPETKVVFISGYTDDPMIKFGQVPEGSVFLQKPFTLGALLDKAYSLLGKTPLDR
ncbi:MAG: response regulator [Acidobacteria bacterium]|nr:response regulator [Acidobacteriota bacterium]